MNRKGLQDIRPPSQVNRSVAEEWRLRKIDSFKIDSISWGSKRHCIWKGYVAIENTAVGFVEERVNQNYRQHPPVFTHLNMQPPITAQTR